MSKTKRLAEIRNRDTGETLVQVFGPGRDDDALSIGLRLLTHQLLLRFPEIRQGGGVFGGAYGYGVDFENEVFAMHYDRQDGDCTCGASEPKHGETCDQVTQRDAWIRARMDFAVVKKTDAEYQAEVEEAVARGVPRRMAALIACGSDIDFSQFEEYEKAHPFPACSCGVLATWVETEVHAKDCEWTIMRAPNFLFKPSGFHVRWYKYIGRDNEVSVAEMDGAVWQSILSACLSSFVAQSLDDALAAYIKAEEEEAEASKRSMEWWTE